MEEVTFAVACKRYFGYKEGKGLSGFRDELKKLTPEDRKWFAIELSKEMKAKVISE